MAKSPEFIPAGSGYGLPQVINENFARVKEALENTLSRDGSTPNAMNADLDMDSNDILNAKAVSAESIQAEEIILKGSPIQETLDGLSEIVEDAAEILDEIRKGISQVSHALYTVEGVRLYTEDSDGKALLINRSDNDVYYDKQLLEYDSDYLVTDLGHLELQFSPWDGALVQIRSRARISNSEAQALIQEMRDETGLNAERAEEAADRAEEASKKSPQSWADFQNPEFLALQDGAVEQFKGLYFERDRAANITGLMSGAGWKYSGTLHVGHFGYDSTAATTSKINDAMLYLKSIGGGTVHIWSGVQPVEAAGVVASRSVCVILRKGVTFETDDGSPCILTYDRTGTNTDILTNELIGAPPDLITTDITVRNIWVDGGGAEPTPAGRGMNFWFRHIKRLRLENVRSVNSTNWGCRIEKCDGVVIRNYSAEHNDLVNADGIHFMDTSNVDMDGGNILTYGDDCFAIEAYSMDVENYNIRGLNLRAPAPGNGRRAGVLIHEESGSGVRKFRNINVQGIVKEVTGPALTVTGAVDMQGCIFDLQVDGAKNGFHAAPGRAGLPAIIARNLFRMSVKDTMETAFWTSEGNNAEFVKNQLDLLVTNPADGVQGVYLSGGSWTGSVVVDYDPDGSKLDPRPCLTLTGDNSDLNLSTYGGSDSVVFAETTTPASGNTIRVGVLKGATNAVRTNYAPPVKNKLVGGHIEGAIVNSTFTDFIGVSGAPFDVMAGSRGLYKVFASRADLVGNLAGVPGFVQTIGWVAYDGSVVEISRKAGSTVISDILGWEPVAPVSVYHYGAVGNGVVNDTAAFNAARASGFLDILVPGTKAQTYIVSGFNVTVSNIRFYGSGKPKIKGIVRSDGNPIILNIISVSNVTFEGIAFEGVINAEMPFNNVTQVYQSTEVTFRKCSFKDCKGIAALVSGGDSVRYLGCSFENCGTYHLTSGVPGDRRQAIAFTSSTNRPEVHGCYFENVGLDCASFATGCTDIRAIKNRVKTNYAGSFYLSQVVGGLVAENIVENGPDGGNAFDIIDSRNLTIVDNIAKRCGAAGIMIAGNCLDILVNGNHLYNNVRSASTLHRGGITFALPAGKHIERITLVGNKCYDDNPSAAVTQRYAIGIQEAGGTISQVKIDPSNDLKGYNSSGVPEITSVFQTQKLGMTGYPTAFNLGAGVEMTLYTADGLLGEFGITEINTSKCGKFFARENQTPVKLLDPDSYFQTTDTGTGVGVYRVEATNSIRMRNRTDAAKTYVINPTALLRK